MFKPLLTACALYVFMESGFVLYELSEEIEWLEGALFGPVKWLVSVLNIAFAYPYFKVGGFLLFLPFIFIFLLWIISRLCKSNLKVSEFIQSIGLVLLPVVAGGHVAKALMEIIASTRIIGGFLIAISPFIAIRYFKKVIIAELALSAYTGMCFIGSLYLISIIGSLR